jgi:hypothetical protein
MTKRPHQAVGGFGFPAPVGQDHEINGLCRVPDYAEDWVGRW